MKGTRRHIMATGFLPLVIAGSLALAACERAAAPVSPEDAALEHALHAGNSQNTPADYHQQLAALRRATAPFHNFAKALAAGWDLQFTPCISNPAGPGAMGFHYVNPALLDGTLDVAEPEALIYEPDANGRLRLVAVEYLVPFDAHAIDQPPPMLYGRPFSPSPAFQVWGLHAWGWKHNPSGMHAPFNPNVSCENA
jgi:hypothetical protein